jgi:hypothetical protein
MLHILRCLRSAVKYYFLSYFNVLQVFLWRRISRAVNRWPQVAHFLITFGRPPRRFFRMACIALAMSDGSTDYYGNTHLTLLVSIRYLL